MYAEDGDSSNASRHPPTSDSEEQTMQGRVQPFEPGALAPAQRELFEAIAGGPRAQGPQHFALTRPDGSLRGPFNAFLLAPELGGALQNLGAAIRYRGALTARAREIAILLVAAHWDSEFEREAHEAVGAASGLTPDELAALRDGDPTAFAGDEAVVAAVTAAAAGRRPRRRNSGASLLRRSARRWCSSSPPSWATTRRLRCSCACSASRRDCGWPCEIAPRHPSRYGFTR